MRACRDAENREHNLRRLSIVFVGIFVGGYARPLSCDKWSATCCGRRLQQNAILLHVVHALITQDLALATRTPSSRGRHRHTTTACQIDKLKSGYRVRGHVCY